MEVVNLGSSYHFGDTDTKERGWVIKSYRLEEGPMGAGSQTSEEGCCPAVQVPRESQKRIKSQSLVLKKVLLLVYSYKKQVPSFFKTFYFYLPKDCHNAQNLLGQDTSVSYINLQWPQCI